MKFSTREIVVMSILIAMAVILRRILSIQLPFGTVSFGSFPIIISGFLFGPVAGGVVGGLSDVVGYPLFSKGPYFPHFTLTAALTGIVPPCVLKLICRNSPFPGFIPLLISICTGQVITKMVLVPCFLNILLGIPFWYSFVTNFMVQVFLIPVYALFSVYVLRAYFNFKSKYAFMENQK